MNTNAFELYLRSENLAESTIVEHLKDLIWFNAWAQSSDLLSIERITYTELLGYVQALRAKQLATATINLRLKSLRKYYEHLKQDGIIEVNPAKRLHIKGQVKSIIIDPFTYTELEEFYAHYSKPREFYREQKSKEVHERNGIILGLMIWQGVHSGELAKIAVDHVNLDQGTIYIPSSKRSNPRVLKLEAKQIISLHKYITNRNFKEDQNGMIPLFSDYTHNTITYLLQELKGINPQLRNARHIRASVILHWLKMYDKRTVQHMLGHRYISSIEIYEVQELTGLTDLLSKHHPFS